MTDDRLTKIVFETRVPGKSKERKTQNEMDRGNWRRDGKQRNFMERNTGTNTGQNSGFARDKTETIYP